MSSCFKGLEFSLWYTNLAAPALRSIINALCKPPKKCGTTVSTAARFLVFRVQGGFLCNGSDRLECVAMS